MPPEVYKFGIVAIIVIVLFALIVIMTRKDASKSVPSAPAKDLPPPSDAVKELVSQGNKINAIKQYREETGAGLKEAKDVVESL
jgi:ribosomal protein L7/L12